MVRRSWFGHARFRLKTADFLPEEAFLDHLDRRRTPMRIAWVGIFATLCLGVAQLLSWQSQIFEQQALDSLQPDEEVLVARGEMSRVFVEMSTIAPYLDPLVSHIERPTAAWLFAGLSAAVGPTASFETLRWSVDSKTGVQLESTALVQDDEALLGLPGRLQKFTGWPRARTLVPETAEMLRVQIEASQPLQQGRSSR